MDWVGGCESQGGPCLAVPPFYFHTTGGRKGAGAMGGGRTGGVSDGFKNYSAEEISRALRGTILGELHDRGINVSMGDGFAAYSTSYTHDPDAERLLSGMSSFFAMLGRTLKKAVSIFGSSPPSGSSSVPPSEGGERPAAGTTITGFQRAREISNDPNSWRVSPIGLMMMQPAIARTAPLVTVYPRNLPLGAMNMSSFMISGRL